MNNINQARGIVKMSYKDEKAIDFDLMEKWLKSYCLDPLTSLEDMSQFRIDLYETEKEWIVEALLTDFDSSEIKVFIEEMKLVITAVKTVNAAVLERKIRCITFPFQVINQKVSANFLNGILEVAISKTEKGLGKSRYITLP
jgi:HSP20 family molecular chaperone IbpA